MDILHPRTSRKAFGSIFTSILLGLALWLVSCNHKHPAFAMHWMYWHLPTNPMTALRATPPSHLRRMVG